MGVLLEGVGDPTDRARDRHDGFARSPHHARVGRQRGQAEVDVPRGNRVLTLLSSAGRTTLSVGRYMLKSVPKQAYVIKRLP